MTILLKLISAVDGIWRERRDFRWLKQFFSVEEIDEKDEIEEIDAIEEAVPDQKNGIGIASDAQVSQERS